jgi:hypothetical protein
MSNRDKEKDKKWRKEYYQKNKKYFNEKTRQWQKNNPEKFKEMISKYTKSEKGRAACKRKYLKSNLKKFTGLTLEQFDEILKRQNGVCAICGKTEEINGQRLSVDHCHTTGMVRGLLCFKCNFMIGQANDSVEILANAIKYITTFIKPE